MGKAEIVIKTLDEIGKAAAEFLPYLKYSKVVAFYGEMGAGKTTFIKALCNCLGVKDTVNSPTFAIINEYFTSGNEPVYHLDLYRLKSQEELLDIGYEDYLQSGSYLFIEWPEKARDLLPEDCMIVHISRENDESRRLRIEFSQV
jgi:tRNA threonylcarbamoyladenosine biosynthesis protein TsaE